MLNKIKGFSVKNKGFGFNKSGRALGGENLSGISFLSVAPEYSVALNEDGKVAGWGLNISGVLDLQNSVNMNFSNISAGYNHVVGVLDSISSEPISFKRSFNAKSSIGRYSCFSGYTGSWNSPVWIPKSLSDPFSGFAKKITITGYFDAGIIVRKYPSNEIIFNEKRNSNHGGNFFSGNFYLNENESYDLSVSVPCLPIIVTGSSNYWACTGVAQEFIVNTGALFDSMVTGWGADDFNQASAGIGLKNVKKVSAGNAFSLALFNNGEVTGWGSNISGQISDLNLLSGIVDISAGSSHSIFLDSGGIVYTRGSNSYGQTNIQIPLASTVQHISAGAEKTIVIYKEKDSLNSRIFATGRSDSDTLKYLNNIYFPSYAHAGYNGWIVVLSDGTVVGTGDMYCNEFNFTGIKNAVYGFNGNKFSQILINDGIKNLDTLYLPFNFEFKGSYEGDHVLNSINVETSLKKDFIYNNSTIVAWQNAGSNFILGFDSGSANFTTCGNIKISGSSLSGKKYVGEKNTYGYLSDPYFDLYRGKNNSYNYYSTLDNWETDYDSGFLQAAIFDGSINEGFSKKDPFLKLKHNFARSLESDFLFKINNIDKDIFSKRRNSFDNVNTRYVFSFSKQNTIIENASVFKNSLESFLTYDVSNGTNYKNCFAYSVEFDKNIESLFYKTNKSDSSLSELYYLPIVNIEPTIITGWYESIRELQSVCIETKPCIDIAGGGGGGGGEGGGDSNPCFPPKATPPKRQPGCIDGRSGDFLYPGLGKYKTELPRSGESYEMWKSGIISGLSNGFIADIDSLNDYLYGDGTTTGKANVPSFSFKGSSGIIVFGDFYSGDKIDFKPYNFTSGDYTGFYRYKYLSDPPYKELNGFTLEFKKDFNTPAELFEKLQLNFSQYVDDPAKTGYLWFEGLGCDMGFGNTGVFEKINMPLAEVFYISAKDVFGTGINEKNIEYWDKRIIGYKSNYFHNYGYSMNLIKSVRRLEEETGVLDGLKYLMPGKVSLYGSQDASSWLLLHSAENINWSKSNIIKTSLDIHSFDKDLEILNKFNTLTGYNDSYAVSGINNLIPKENILADGGFSFNEIETTTDPHYQKRELFSVEITGVEQQYPWCPAKYKTETVTINYAGSGNSCFVSGSTIDWQKPDFCIKNEPSGIKPVSLFSVKTGWLIDYNNIGVSKNELKNLNFNYFMLKLDDLSSDDSTPGLKPVDFFHLKKLNLFSLTENENLPNINTEIKCWDGGIYTMQPQAFVPVDISGSFTADVRTMDSGVRSFQAANLSGRIVGKSSGDYVRFNRASGRIVSDSGVGIYNGKLYATGTFCTGISDWYYDTGTKVIKNFDTFCSNFSSGSGYFSGSYLRIKPEIVNRDLALGRWLNPIYDINVETGVSFSGYFYAEDYVFNTTGYLKIPFEITGTANSGAIDFNKVFQGSSLNSGLRLNVDPTGYSYASGWIKINNALLTDGDFVSLNNNVISYNPNSVNAPAPSYFKDFQSLSEIFTGALYSELFNSSFLIDSINGSIFIKSKIKGESGNNINFSFSSSSGGISGINGFVYDGLSLRGGQTFYQYISGTGEYTYNLNLSGYPVTGFYYFNSGSGFISGPVKTYQGERDFTGVWSLLTGTSVFLQKLLPVSGSGKLFSGRYAEDGLGTYPERLAISVGYQDKFNIGQKDASILTVFDKNYKYNNNLITGSGVSIIIENY